MNEINVKNDDIRCNFFADCNISNGKETFFAFHIGHFTLR